MENRPNAHRVSTGTIIGIFLAGMVAGYIIGLWQQAAQRQQRLDCEACRQHDQAIRDCSGSR